MNAQEFLKKIKENSAKSVSYGKDSAVKYFQSITNATKKDAEAFYSTVRSAYVEPNIVVNTSIENLVAFLETGIWAHGETSGDASSYSKHRDKFSSELGIKPIAYGSITHRPSGDRRFGPVSMSLNGVEEFTACLAGDVLRAADPGRPDYVPDPMLALYVWEDVADCKASSSILSMPSGRILQGVASILQDIMDGVEFGRAEAFVLGGISQINSGRLVVASPDEARVLRDALSPLSMFVPVYVDSKRDQIVDAWSKQTDVRVPLPVPQPMRYFAIGDQVVTKPMASSLPKHGQIIDMSNGLVTVEWEDASRSVWGLSESMSRLMSAPKAPKEQKGLTGYVLDGMDDRTARLLSSYGYDPVSLYSVVSHVKPASPMASGWVRPMLEKLEAMGIKATKTTGFRETKAGNIAFCEHKWFEARLPDHCRLVIDVNSEEVRIVAGEADEYVKPRHGPMPIWG